MTYLSSNASVSHSTHNKDGEKQEKRSPPNRRQEFIHTSWDEGEYDHYNFHFSSIPMANETPASTSATTGNPTVASAPQSPQPQVQAPKQGKIRLILYSPANSADSLYLDIPTSIPTSLCQHPRKYLRYLGWCILGVEGLVSMDSPDSEDNIGNEGTLEDRGVYRYSYNGDLEGLSFFIGTYIVPF